MGWKSSGKRNLAGMIPWRVSLPYPYTAYQDNFAFAVSSPSQYSNRMSCLPTVSVIGVVESAHSSGIYQLSISRFPSTHNRAPLLLSIVKRYTPTIGVYNWPYQRVLKLSFCFLVRLQSCSPPSKVQYGMAGPVRPQSKSTLESRVSTA